MTALRPRSVAGVVAAVLVTVTTVVLAMLGALDYRSRRQQEWAGLRHRLVAQADQLAVALALPVWNIDRSQVDRILESIGSTPIIRGVSVSAGGLAQARVRDAEGHMVATADVVVAKGELVEARPILFSGERIGVIRLVATPRYVEAELRDTLISSAISAFVTDLVLILVVYLVLWGTVLQPLRAVERYAIAVNAGGARAAAPIRGAFTKDLENLRSSIEGMVGLLDRRYVELEEQMARRMESEERLRASQEMFEKVFRSNPAMMVIVSLGSGRGIVDANDSMLETFGLHREEVIGRSAVDLGLWNAAAREQWLAELLQEGRLRDRPVELEGRLGRRSILMSSEIVSIGAEPYALVMAHDRTEQLAAERRLAESQENLRRQETLASIGSLIAGVAHEVRTPLFSISATLDAFEGGTPEELEEGADRLRAQVRRLSNLMSDLLDYGRPPVLQLETGGIAEIVQQATRSCAAMAADAGVTVQAVLPLDALKVARDAQRLEQAVQNLLANAVQHSNRGAHVRVVVQETRRDGRGYVLCRVEDEGPGIPEENLPRVFEPFFTRRKGGTGLGLSIVQRIVEAHGGTIVAVNRPTGGAAFTMTFPVADGEEIGHV